ncbi:MAG: phosphoenolpyruvate--protein phosphotransferase [Chloroflexi bacterium]|nr:phosphoenolpyruvate--protein phosphotransferase [Chloroflexota bacterium]
MRHALSGVAAAPGVAIAAPWTYQPPQGGSEVLGLAAATDLAQEQLAVLAGRLRALGRDEEAGIFDAQSLMAADPELMAAAERHVAGGATASAAIVAAGSEMAALLAGLDDEILAARAADVIDVAERIARAIRGLVVAPLERRSVAVAVDLPPSVTAELDPEMLVGIALEAGTRTAHAAILARALGIPAVVGVAGLLDAAAGAGSIGINGDSGEVVVDPGSDDLESLELARLARQHVVEAEAALRELPLSTSDGHRVMLGANIGIPQEAVVAAGAGAEGVGLFRTEFLFMSRVVPPPVDVQAAEYARVLAAFPGMPVVFRMLDVGGDKPLPYVRLEREENPFLGVRGIRLAGSNRALLVDQLRAIVRAAAAEGADAWIMAPMIADLADVAVVRDLLAEASAGEPPASVRLGIMVELPSAVFMADQLAAAVDFFSIGTNDLTQYLMAADRTNAALGRRHDPMHPAVLRAIREVVDAGHAARIPVAVCGEMAGDRSSAVVLAGMGIDELSMDPVTFGAVKGALRAVTLAEAADLAERACAAGSAEEARRIVHSHLPDPVGRSA